MYINIKVVAFLLFATVQALPVLPVVTDATPAAAPLENRAKKAGDIVGAVALGLGGPLTPAGAIVGAVAAGLKAGEKGAAAKGAAAAKGN
ncbi:hypothetical protein BP6252_13632 [Coleophoma cylindrospora]|uniref:Uncharacterized protein n=1 Tax=Coleophoma cylindrospora TaxID=1849047 RepID=A0A3D8Q8U6_9HELO|nr:hypothetical protein BP6252_13632 [Coleophoma cylindrospora]